MTDEEDRAPASEQAPISLRGRLATVYFPALLGGSERALASRLGDRATTYHPRLGAAAGLAAIEEHLTKLGQWLAGARASYVHQQEIVGVDRDVTEGVLSLRVPPSNPARAGGAGGAGAAEIDQTGARLSIALPVACVMHRRKGRKADLRAYHAMLPLGGWQAPRSPREAHDGEDGYVLAADIAEHLAALRLGDAEALVAGFEREGHLRDGAGRVHPLEGGALHAFYVATLQSERGANDWVPLVIAAADNGRCCAVEYTTEKLRGGESAPKEGLVIFERGDSGRLRSVRMYDELGLSSRE
ncbi:hypothetical protein [Pendulispora albinea]|uniref:SnoaL-like domain-containing protein n=1 Tax=Pendulispora albinea TaxID=2741071 RepID=A0ABZ2M664_9BACT